MALSSSLNLSLNTTCFKNHFLVPEFDEFTSNNSAELIRHVIVQGMIPKLSLRNPQL